MIARIESGLDVRKVITHRLPAEKFLEGFEIRRRGESGKSVLDWAGCATSLTSSRCFRADERRPVEILARLATRSCEARIQMRMPTVRSATKRKVRRWSHDRRSPRGSHG